MTASRVDAFVASITENEKKFVKYIELLSKSDPAKAADWIKEWTQEKVVRYTLTSPILTEFCRHDAELQVLWAEELKQHAFPNIAIATKNGEIITVYDHYVSDYLSVNFLEISRLNDPNGALRTKILNQACSFGSYDGLLNRCRFKLSILHSNTISERVRDEMIAHIDQDAVRLSRLYAAIGFVQAGIVFLKLTRVIYVFDKSRSEAYFEKGVQYFLCAALLADNSYSNRIISVITKGKGLTAIFGDAENAVDNNLKIEFSSWLAVKSKLSSWVNADTFGILSHRAQQEVGAADRFSPVDIISASTNNDFSASAPKMG